ncbi:AraC family transcriptional regulator [Vibrio sp. 2-Bac 85]
MHYHPERIHIESGTPGNMECYHWHGHVEINLPFRDKVDYLINGRKFTIAEGHIGIFWAANPHMLYNRHQCQEMMIAYIPIQEFLCWPLEDKLFNDVLNGATLCSRHVYKLSKDQLRQWIKDFMQQDKTLSALVADELQIMLRRVSFYGWKTLLNAELQPEERITRASTGLDQVQGMLDYIAHNYNTPITTKDIAKQVGLHPNYAMNQFKKVMRISIKKYIHRIRINHAKAYMDSTCFTTINFS